ncbi:MAG: hypothetical protein D6675_05855 [Gemmatimonadetes bacterium]|nr:MAG: hypothetical protein D6675_05855 [Gemmatimonadota bacterium]
MYDCPFTLFIMSSSLHLNSASIDWLFWECLIETNGISIDRPYGTAHPEYPHIIYPLDYGYINNTTGLDGMEVDIFVGSANNGLVAMIFTNDYRRGDQEFKLIYNCTPPEIYCVNGFINYDRTLMEGKLLVRYPLHTLWRRENLFPR